MKDFINLLWALLGALVGIGVGLLADFLVFARFGETIQRNPTVAGIVLFGLPALGMVAGGWVTLYITAKLDKARREKARQERKKFVPKRRKKK